MATQSDQPSGHSAPAAPLAVTLVKKRVSNAVFDTIVRYVLFLGVAALVVVADQITKLIVVRTLKSATPIDFLGGLVRLDYTSNTGAAFGMFQNQSAVFAAVSLIVGIGIVVSFYWLGHSSWPIRFGLSLVLGGAAGNVLDRIRIGYVVDFIDLRWWPVFNLADSAVVIGVALLMLASVLSPTTAHDAVE